MIKKFTCLSYFSKLDFLIGTVLTEQLNFVGFVLQAHFMNLLNCLQNEIADQKPFFKQKKGCNQID